MVRTSTTTLIIKGAFLAAFLSVAEAAMSSSLAACARSRGVLSPLPADPDTLGILPFVMWAGSALSSFGFGVLLVNLAIFALFVPLDLRSRGGDSGPRPLVPRLAAVTLFLAGSVLVLPSPLMLALIRIAVLVVGTGAVYAWWVRRLSTD